LPEAIVSQKNLDVVRAVFTTWNEGDMDAYRDLLTPDVVMSFPEDWLEQGPFVGREAVLRQVQGLRSTWDGSDRAEPIGDFVEVGERVVVRWAWRAAGQGPDLNMEITCVCTLHDGLNQKFEFFWDHAEALAAAGRA
jgi:ketosteroid isomerase-like protein